MENANKNEIISDDDLTHTPDLIDSFIPTNDSLLVNIIESSKKNSTFNLSNYFAKQDNIPRKSVLIDIQVEFLRFGQIETKNERFDAEFLIKYSWEDQNILSDLINQLNAKTTFNEDCYIFKDLNEVMFFNRTANEFKFDASSTKKYWAPNIIIKNAIGELKEEFIRKIELIDQNDEPLNLLLFNDVVQLNSAIKNGSLKVRVIEKRKVKGIFYQVI